MGSLRPRTSPIRQLVTADDYETPSPLDSYLWWRDHYTDKSVWDIFETVTGKPIFRSTSYDVMRFFRERVTSPGPFVCQQCADRGGFALPDGGGNIICLCHLMDWIHRQVADINPLRSMVKIQPFTTFDKRREMDLVAAYELAKTFARYPDRWLILSGPSRIGKTHLLGCIQNAFGPISLYMTVSDLVGRIYAATREGTLSDVIDDVSRAPILLLDDLGAEHRSQFGEAQLLHILNFRYILPEEYPVAITTNLTKEQFFLQWGRIGARVSDERFTFIEIDAPAYDGGNHGS